MSNYYIRKIIREFKKMALSIGFFGSPRTLVKHVRDGISDFLELPAEGWRNGGLGSSIVGVGKGTLSLTKNVAVGATQSVQMLNMSVSQALLLLG